MIRGDAIYLRNILLETKMIAFDRDDTEPISDNGLLAIFRYDTDHIACGAAHIASLQSAIAAGHGSMVY